MPGYFGMFAEPASQAPVTADFQEVEDLQQLS